jgi:hypothetical protein
MGFKTRSDFAGETSSNLCDTTQVAQRLRSGLSLIDLAEKVTSTPHLRMETDPVSKMLHCLEYRTIDKV